MSPSTEHSCILSPFGEPDPDMLGAIGREISRTFGLPTQITPLLQDLEFALDSNRGQYHSTPILERLAASAPPLALRVVGVARVDLFIPILTHVYGEAQLGGRACIVSSYRLDEDLPPTNPRETLTLRMVKEAVHELGHTFDLRHCKDPLCIMHYCRSLHDVDTKSLELCRYCRILLRDGLEKAERQEVAGGI